MSGVKTWSLFYSKKMGGLILSVVHARDSLFFKEKQIYIYRNIICFFCIGHWMVLGLLAYKKYIWRESKDAAVSSQVFSI